MKRQLDQLTKGSFDLLILGGGITGAGVALDAALRGFRVALIDKGDFASGTSSVSSKLVHGGLRYLEHGDFSLVYEALHERQLLLQNAPHLVHPLRFVIPVYQGSRLPSWQWRIALTLYDFLAGNRNLRRSRPLLLDKLTQLHPQLVTDQLQAGAEYFDAQMDDARLCLEVIKTSVGQGAVAANYVEALAFEQEGGRVAGVQARDQVTGQRFRIHARQILNATGPWVDAVCRLAGEAGGPQLKPTKGVHLVVPDRKLRSAFLLLHPADGRVFFVIPWLGKTLIGTTDTFVPEGPDQLWVTPADVDYLLEGHNRFLKPALKAEDVLGSFVGLRPLIGSKPGEPSSISREFKVIEGPSGLVSVAGGKFTTYRRMAETVTDILTARLGSKRCCQTRDFRLDGAPPGKWAEFAERQIATLCLTRNLDEAVVSHLVHRYGRRVAEVLSYLDKDPQLARPIVAGEPDIQGELAYQRDHEMAVSPADHLLRRTRLGLFHPQLLAGENHG